MTGDPSVYVTSGVFILVAADKYVVRKCCHSACYTSGKCYLLNEVMREYYFKELTDVCCF